MVIKIIALVLAAIIVMGIGYMVVASVINLFNGYTFGESIANSWEDITTLWGLIKRKVETEVQIQEYPMANTAIAWNTNRGF